LEAANRFARNRYRTVAPERLVLPVGSDHDAFLELKGGCEKARQELGEVHRELNQHRNEHGC
jgi:hypothetical protein